MSLKKTRSRMAPAERKIAIILQAREYLREVGYESFLPTEVAKRCGISEATIYHYFDTRQELLIKVCEHWMQEMLSAMPKLDEIDGIYERLRQGILYTMQIVQKEPELTRFIFLFLRSEAKYKSMEIFTLNQTFTRLLRDVLQQAIDTGLFRHDVSTKLLRDMIFGAVEHQVWGFLRQEADFPVESTTDAMIQIIWNGALDNTNPRNQPL